MASIRKEIRINAPASQIDVYYGGLTTMMPWLNDRR